MNHTASWRTAPRTATMTPMTAARTAAVIAAATALTVTGCTAPSTDHATPPAAVDPTACQLDHDGSPATPTRLLLDCESTTWTMPGPWADRETRYLDDVEDAERDGWTLTKGIVVDGDARAWLTGHGLSCVATRDLLDTDEATRVRCNDLDPEPATPTPAPPAPSSPSA